MVDTSPKICALCNHDCSRKPRTKDARGRYYCKSCYELAEQRQSQPSLAHSPPRVEEKEKPRMPAPASGVEARTKRTPALADEDDRGEYGLERSIPALSPPAAPSNQNEHGASTPTPALCPSCGHALPPNSVICVPCGINVVTGRSFVTAEQGDTDRVYEHARGILWFVSWILWLGLLPISSEAHGSRRPHALRVIALLTVILTVWMWWFEWTGSPRMQVLKNQFHWVGDATPDAEHIEMFYEVTSYGDYRAYERKKAELSGTTPLSDLPLAALNSLSARQRCLGDFHWWQLISHAFLHGGILHLLGNMLFLVIFGSRINALIGNVGMIVLYPILAVLSAAADMIALAHEMPTPALGASGAIMGLAGMYLVFFPVSPVHVAAFIRVPVLLLWIFKCRGFWILLYFIAWDVFYTLLQIDTGTAHWAHLGGFVAGMAIGLALVLTRGVNARGNDLISVLLGQRAWSIIGKPSQWQQIPHGEGWLTRARLVPEGVWNEIIETLSIKRRV